MTANPATTQHSSENPIKILYIAGVGRSGSTLFERVLGQDPRLVAIGELRQLWQEGLEPDELCGCGRPFKDCPVWQSIIDEVFGGFEGLNQSGWQQLRWSVDRTLYIPWMILPRLRPQAYEARFTRYSEQLLKLYHALVARTGSNTIINSSKNPPTIYLLSQLPAVEVHVVHLVRDSRAVAFSWQRKRRRPEVTDRVEYMHRVHPAVTAAQWMYRNALVWLSRRWASSYRLVRYEDFLREPYETIGAVRRQAGYDDAPDYIQGDEVSISQENHTVGGNPMRFKKDNIQLKLDDEWRRTMPVFQKNLVTIITLPLLWGYGYLKTAAGEQE